MTDCPHCEYNKKRAQNWREEAYRLAGHPLPRKEEHMTENEVTVMLAEAIDQDREYKSWHVSTKHLMTLVEMVVAQEREACAKIADKEYQDAKTIEETHYKYSDAPFNPRQFGLNMDLVDQSKYLSFAIRARGQA